MIKSRIRTIPNYPKPGVMFRDITTLLADAHAFRQVIDQISDAFRGADIDTVAGIEARGFIVGAAVSFSLGVGFVPIRKAGKLPWSTLGQDYELEYGVDRVEMHTDAVNQDDRVLLVDDLIATGGTAEAAVHLVRQAGGIVAAGAFVIDLPELGGRDRIQSLGVTVHTLCAFEGE